MFNIGRAADEILMCCCTAGGGGDEKGKERGRDGLLSAWHLLIYCRQVPEAVEELRETTPPAGQQPQGQADWQAEADAERGGLREEKQTRFDILCLLLSHSHVWFLFFFLSF